MRDSRVQALICVYSCFSCVRRIPYPGYLLPEELYTRLQARFHIPTGIHASQLDYTHNEKKIEVILVGLPTSAGPILNCSTHLPSTRQSQDFLLGNFRSLTKSENSQAVGKQAVGLQAIADDFIHILVQANALASSVVNRTEIVARYGSDSDPNGHWSGRAAETFCDVCMKTNFSDSNPLIECDQTKCLAGRHLLCWPSELRPLPTGIASLQHFCSLHVRASHLIGMPRRAHRTARVSDSDSGTVSSNLPPRAHSGFTQAGSQFMHNLACDGLAFNAESLGVVVRQSSIPGAGLGLFTVNAKAPGTLVGYLFGAIVSQVRFQQLQQSELQTAEISSAEREFLDDEQSGICRSLDISQHMSDEAHEYLMLVSRQCPAGYINDPRQRAVSKSAKSNCEIIWPFGHAGLTYQSFVIRTTRTVAANEELFFDYSYNPSGRSKRVKILAQQTPPRALFQIMDYLHYLTPPGSSELSEHNSLVPEQHSGKQRIAVNIGPRLNASAVPPRPFSDDYSTLTPKFSASQADEDQLCDELEMDAEAAEQALCEQVCDDESEEDEEEDDEDDEWTEHDVLPQVVGTGKRITMIISPPETSQLAVRLECVIRSNSQTRALPHYKSEDLSKFELTMVHDEAAKYLTRMNQRRSREGKPARTIQNVLHLPRAPCNLSRLANDFAEVRACCADPVHRAALPANHPFASLRNFVINRFDLVDGQSSIISFLKQRLPDPLRSHSLHCVIPMAGVRICESCFRAFTGRHRTSIFKLILYIKTGKLRVVNSVRMLKAPTPVTDTLVALLFRLCNEGWADGAVPNPTNKTVDDAGNVQYTLLDAPFTQRTALCEDLGVRLYGEKRPGIPRQNVCTTTLSRALAVLKANHKIFLSLALIKRFMKCTTCQTFDNEKKQAKTIEERSRIVSKRNDHFRQVAGQRKLYSLVRDQAKSVNKQRK